MRLSSKLEVWWYWLLVKLHLRKPDPILWMGNIGWKNYKS
jgi:hypothetical protein